MPITQTQVKRHNIKQSGTSIKGRIKHFLKQFLPISFIMKIQKKINMGAYQDIAKAKGDLFLSIGGDIYCYDSYAVLDYLNIELNKTSKTALIGCSITPERIKQDKNLRADLQRYSLIIARESITYKALIENGINKNTHLFPDPAFALDTQETPLPNNFIIGNTVGINISPLIQRLEKGKNLAYKNIQELIKYILSNTNMNICLIAHVIWDSNNDLEPLASLYKEFKNTGRISLVGQTQNCCELKYIISKCRFLIAARTHASIAAYSTQVPTLVIGYSVKAKGIAKDIFGKYEGYVMPVQELKDEKEILTAFKTLQDKEQDIRAHYSKFMPEYVKQSYKIKEEIIKLL